MDTDRIVADLHAHTTVSDGAMTVDELAATAADAGLDWVAATDHDRIHPDLGAPVVEREGVRVVRGIELRVDAGFERLDLLGYAVERTDALDEETDRLQADRQRRGAAILDAVEDRLGVDLGVEPRPGLGRPHIARAIDESAAPCDYAGAFDELIGDDGPCYVARDVTALDRGVELLRDACAFVGLAHPFRYGDVDAALDVARELDAVERFYPYGRPVDDARVERVAAEHDLLLTGGSDAHERTLAEAGLTAEAFEPVRDRLPSPS
ncbi:PHP domain-containing protein [Halorubrum sp. SD626R]|jgi:predicted metal-dependent phosphoesterase TrpH|uniref:PHP domain-containing protein n=1 Tax=Halorubrum sp. SD626R TaxID=1419722 RepID=UPI000ACBECBE|nr:PHP domain-containing protein [Halorubrum sp. SD626R]TKX80376.1 PHP domain-containing protein [Halorubrum sp. SD626R]